MSGGRGAAGGGRQRVGPQGRATPMQSFGSMGSTPGGAQPQTAANTTPANSPRFGPRYETRSITQRPATVGNIATALAGALPGGGVIQAGISAAKGTPGDPYSGPSEKATGFSMDSKGGAGTPAGGKRPRARRTGLGAGIGAATLG